MSEQEFGAKVRQAYQNAIAARSTRQGSPPSPINHLFQVPVYGKEGGRDFADTNATAIKKHCLDAAEACHTAAEFPISCFGNSAREGLVEGLAQATGVRVTFAASVLRIAWA